MALPSVVALAGGVGGAKLAEGLQAHLAGRLAVVVNTADDCERHGLVVMPDHDTVLYTLAGLEQAGLGWGIEGDTHAVMDQLAVYGEPTWFSLGDRDIALHVVRTAAIRAGQRRTEACLHAQRSLGIAARILPMTDAVVATAVETAEGWLEFQEYFVHRRQGPDVTGLRFDGIDASAPTPEVRDALATAGAVILGPSNPLVSIGPILAVPGMRALLDATRARGVRVAAVSPIVGGRALKGPADRMLASLGHEVSALGVARLYADLIDVFVLDEVDAALAPAVEALGPQTLVTDTVMGDDASRTRLAGEVLRAVGIAGPPTPRRSAGGNRSGGGARATRAAPPTGQLGTDAR